MPPIRHNLLKLQTIFNLQKHYLNNFKLLYVTQRHNLEDSPLRGPRRASPVLSVQKGKPCLRLRYALPYPFSNRNSLRAASPPVKSLWGMRGGGVGEGRRGLSSERPLLPSPTFHPQRIRPCLNFPDPAGSAKRPARCKRPQWTRRACPPNSSSSTSAASAAWNSPPARKPSSPAISFPA